ncbi:MAG: SDR family NAD(P)-dependent oxidoreductase [Candidatus Peribacteraceae bacterium]|nr:SDR family NAD(P)-dependent oxidoreductase [Candidatus Peribacteraceae bacterium]
MFSLTGKVALVTGAMRGMGEADAIALAAQGATVIVTDIDQKACEAVAKKIESAGGKAVAFAMNVTDKKQIDAVFDAVIKQFKRLDILVNNAGIFKPKPALELTEQDWQQTIDINLKGYFLCAQRAAKEMAKKKYGRIINIASIACGQVGVGFMGSAHYSATKGGVIGMTETMAMEWAPLGITVNAIGPGAIDTPMIGSIKESPEAMQTVVSRVPLKRMGRPEEIAAAVVFLASDEASYVTGATLFVDGGYLAA